MNYSDLKGEGSLTKRHNFWLSHSACVLYSIDLLKAMVEWIVLPSAANDFEGIMALN